jgi:MFS family permease
VSTVVPEPGARSARTAVSWSFALNGWCFASWASRIPDVRGDFELSNAALGLVLLAIACGSLVALPTTGAMIARWGTVRVVRSGTALASVGLLLAGLGIGVGVLPLTVVGLLSYGTGTGSWDGAMNVEGAEVERRLGRSIMPKFHAGFSLGTVVGALGGAGVVALGVPPLAHLTVVAAVVAVGSWRSSGLFLPVEPPPEEPVSARGAWLEPHTLVIGLMVLALAMTEGTANDWLAVALVDGHDTSHALGVAGFAGFVASMTVFRMLGADALDRFGRPAVLWATILAAIAGVMLIVLGSGPLVVLGILLWGAGASLGFPVGMSAAADDPRHSAARVSVVSTIGYAAFLTGPPLVGFVGNHVGTLDSLWVVVAVLVPAALTVPAARKPRRQQ